VSRNRVIAWLVVVPGAVWAAVRLAGVGSGWPVIPMLAFTPYVLLATLVPLLVTVLLRQWWAAAVAFAVTAALAGSVLPRGFGAPDPPGVANGPMLRVLTVNMKVGAGSPADIVRLVRDRDVDLLALQEFTPHAQRALEAAGLLALLPDAQRHPVDNPSGSALYSRYPLTDAGYRPLPGDFGQEYATLHVPGAPAVLVESVHPCAPAEPALLPCWRAGLDAEPRADRNGPVRLLLGDFNSTLDHAPLRSLLRSGYRDAAATLGDGFVGTWPYDGTRLPKVTLDHVLADPRMAIRSLDVYPIRRTDHRGVYAELTLPSAPPHPTS
jgi:endonuclease/exonuclease/phosphatase family metal-dependent hydrolase